MFIFLLDPALLFGRPSTRHVSIEESQRVSAWAACVSK